MKVSMYHDDAFRRGWIGVGLVVMAWLTLALWSWSPYAAWLDHGQMGALEASLPVRMMVFALGWTLMVIAMMLPGTLPVVTRAAGSAPVIVAWATVWLGFGALSYLADNILHEVAHHAPSLAGVIAPGLLLLAGIYQLMPVKRHFLQQCRPGEMVRGGLDHMPAGKRWSLGVRHGLNCVGSCWALMLLMMAFGGMNLLGMLLLGVVMTAERLTRHGHALTLVLGALLIAAAGVMLVQMGGVPHQAAHTH